MGCLGAQRGSRGMDDFQLAIWKHCLQDQRSGCNLPDRGTRLASPGSRRSDLWEQASRHPAYGGRGDGVDDPVPREFRADRDRRPQFALAYGESLSAGPLTCTSAPSGMTCTDASTGNYFRVSRESFDIT